jgi:hypothetical protein
MTIKTLCISGLLAVLSFIPAVAQMNTLTGTTTSAAVSKTDVQISLTSATGVVLPSASNGFTGSVLYVKSPGSTGEAMRVQSLVSGTTYKVSRTGMMGTKRSAQVSGALVFIGPANQFYDVDPAGACVTASLYVSPYVNVLNGRQWLCSTVTLAWVPSWGNTSYPAGATTAVASAAGAVLPSGPLFHMTGTSAVTGFTLPLGIENGDSFCALADGIWTWTAAGNIAAAGTATSAGRASCFTWDAAAVKWYPWTLA